MKGLEALPASTRVAVIYSLLYDSDTRVRAVARKELLTLPFEVLKAYVEENPHPKVLDFLVRNIPRSSPALPLLASAPNLSHRTKSFLKSQGITPQLKSDITTPERIKKAKPAEEKPLEVDLEWKPDAEDFELPEGVEFSMPTEDDEPEIVVSETPKKAKEEIKANLEDTTPAFEYREEVSPQQPIAPPEEQEEEKMHEEIKEEAPTTPEEPSYQIEARAEEMPISAQESEEEETAPEIGGMEEEAGIEWKPIASTFKPAPTISEELFPVRVERREEKKTLVEHQTTRPPIEKIQPRVTPAPSLKVKEHKSYFLKGILIGSAISLVLVLGFFFIYWTGFFKKGGKITHSQDVHTPLGTEVIEENTQNSTAPGQVKTVDILLGSYTSAGKAEQARQKAEALGLVVSVSQRTDEKTLWVVSSSNPEARGYCGSYSSEEGAKKCALALKAAGYPAGVSKVTRKTTTYTVKVKDISEDKIEETLETLESAGFKPRVM